MLSPEVEPHLGINPVHPFVVPQVVQATQVAMHHPESPAVVNLGEFRETPSHHMIIIRLWFVVVD